MLDIVSPSVDANVVREIWKNTIDAIVKEGPYVASGMKGTSDHIFELSCRIPLPGLPKVVVDWGLYRAIHYRPMQS